MKFLITPNYRASYDQRMVSDLASGFQVLGHQACALPGPVSALALAQKCKQLSIDVVIQVNRTRSPTVSLPPNVRYISWFQDVFPETMNEFAQSFRASDILYALGDPGVLGLNVGLPCYTGSLVSGVSPAVLNYSARSPANPVDFSLCGFIPHPLDLAAPLQSPTASSVLQMMPNSLRVVLRTFVRRYIRRSHVPTVTRLMLMETVHSMYRPLCGALDIHELATGMRARVAALSQEQQIDLRKSSTQTLHGSTRADLENRSSQSDFPPFERQISFFAREYPRLLDRVALIDDVLRISNSLELYGPGWRSHPNFRPYAKGVLNAQGELLDVYSRSRINLANNTHGLGLHSRTLECMAIGGFVFTHRSPHDNKPGGMLTSFEPGVHFGVFSPESLREDAQYWLRNDHQRMKAGRAAAMLVRQQHCWHHRAQQILDDLAK